MTQDLINAYNELQSVYVHGSENVMHLANAFSYLQKAIEESQKQPDLDDTTK